MSGNIRRDLRFVVTLTKLRLSRLMVFRLSFFGAFFVDGTLFAVQLLVFDAIYAHVDAIGSWNRGQMMVFIGTFCLINALNMAVFFFGVIGIPAKIQTGLLDHYLTKPVSPLLRLTFEEINPGSLPLVLLSGVLIARGVSLSGVRVTPGLCMAYLGFVLLMTLLWYDMMLILRTIPFLVIAHRSLEQLEGNMLSLNMQMPGILYQGAFKVLFYLVLPYGIMATLPTQLLTRTISPGEIAFGIAVAAAFTAFALWFWRFCLRRYKSASS